ncbi:MAG TPA: hypothetical protein GXZ50_06600 [Clostridia bacterium]|jgi:Tfp pilus assembly protein PilX|nr:hypothetical protein [Clostridia bacterium]
MILFILLTLSFAIIAMTSSELKISSNHIKSTQAFYIAEAGIAQAISLLYANPKASGIIIEKMPIGNGEVTVTGNWSDNIIKLEAVGKVKGTQRTVKQILRVEVADTIPASVEITRLRWSEGQKDI